MSKAAKVWVDLDALGVPGVQGVWSPPEAAGGGMTVVSIKQLYAGHAAQTMALAAQCMGGAYFTKYIIVVEGISILPTCWRWSGHGDPLPASVVHRHSPGNLEHLP